MNPDRPVQTFSKPWHAATHAALDRAPLTTALRAAMLRTLTDIRSLQEN